MKDSLILEGKIYISARRAAKIINYAQDYIGQLCRGGKLDCKMVGRSWFVTEESLLAHRENAIDATEDRVSKIVSKEVSTAPKVTPVVAPAIAPVAVAKPVEKIAPVVSIIPVAPAAPASSFKYETENTPLLPALNKKIPSPFAVPKNLKKTFAHPFPQSVFPKSISKPTAKNSLHLIASIQKTPALNLVVVAFLLAGTLTLGSMMLSSSLSRNTGNSTASVASAIGDFFGNVFRGLTGLSSRLVLNSDSNPAVNVAPVATVTPPSTSTTTLASQYNGIGVVPSSQSLSADELEKAKIRNSFSDDVTIRPDKSGTAGVITPVFKKTTGDDFVYVLVPVKDKQP